MNISSKIHQTQHFFRHFLLAVDGHSIQAPFAYAFYQNVIRPKKHHIDTKAIEASRSSLINDHTDIFINDLGAGSQHMKGATRKISSIAKHGISSKASSLLLSRIISYLNCQNNIELGGSLGINTLYLALANKKGHVYSFEGSESLTKTAERLVKKHKIENIDVIEGNIDATLAPQLLKLSSIDFAYLDANHTYEATLKYFNLLKQYANDNTVIVLDDIYWSREMTNAWKTILQSDDIGLSFDLFDIGIVFFRKGAVKQHYVVRF